VGEPFREAGLREERDGLDFGGGSSTRRRRRERVLVVEIQGEGGVSGPRLDDILMQSK